MSKLNVTIDDFDPVLTYTSPADWVTPNPQDHPDWFNQTQAETGSVWHEGTYHWTGVSGSSVGVNFTGSSIWIYGATSSSPNYTITIDPSSAQPFSASYATQNASNADRTLLYSTTELSYSPHTLQLTNNGDGLLLDLILAEVELGAEGAVVTNTTIDETASQITYTGDWKEENGTFYGGSSIYTSGNGPSMQFNFTGSTVYLFGDQVNDHGLYSVYLNGSTTPYATLNGRSGCGGGWAKYCEKLGGLKFFANNLPPGEHTLKLVNASPESGNVTYFDFDYAVYTTPSNYSAQTLQGGSCPFSNCTGSTTTGASGTASTASQTASSTSGGQQQLGTATAVMWMALAAWGTRRLFGW